jgi:hypothetical protein
LTLFSAHEKDLFAHQALRRLRQTLFLEKKMGKSLGRGQILQRPLPERKQKEKSKGAERSVVIFSPKNDWAKKFRKEKSKGKGARQSSRRSTRIGFNFDFEPSTDISEKYSSENQVFVFTSAFFLLLLKILCPERA